MTSKDSDFKNIPDSIPDENARRIEHLEEKLQHIKDARSEERFIFVVIIILLLNVVFFSVLPNFAGPLALLILELLVLIPFAKKMGMQEISEILDRIIHRAAKSFNEKDQ